jgi:ribosomal protein S18 acetylase RimI-like enzyme
MPDDLLLSRIEDASINASAPPQQRWLDGWILRANPGKAKRARCVNAVAPGRMPLDLKLQHAARYVAASGLPLVVRLTRFTQPADPEDQLAERGFTTLDDTRVMVLHPIPRLTPAPAPDGTQWQRLDASAYAEAVGLLRGSPPDQRAAHAERLAHCPVPYRGHALVRRSDGRVLACGQYAREDDLAGLYDVFTHPEHRSQGLARQLCERLLSAAQAEGAHTAYLQLEADNTAAGRLYRRLGFVEGYAYHYRQAPPG